MSNLLASFLELCKKLEARIEELEAENKALRRYLQSIAR